MNVYGNSGLKASPPKTAYTTNFWETRNRSTANAIAQARGSLSGRTPNQSTINHAKNGDARKNRW